MTPSAEPNSMTREPEGKNLLSIAMRAMQNSLQTKDVGQLHHFILRHRALIAGFMNPSFGNLAAQELIDFVNKEKGRVATTRKVEKGDSPETQKYRIELECHKRINELYLVLGMAKMLTQGDWSVNRDREIPASLGVASFAEIESMLLNFYHENGLIENTEPVNDEKLVHLDCGCGNGVVAHRLRQNNTTPFQNGHILPSYWEEIGYADFIYWTFNDFLRDFVTDEYKDNPGLNEFIDMVSTLLMRKIHDGMTKNASSKELESLMKLPENPNGVIKVLLNVQTLIEDFSQIARIRADGEFLSDTDKTISRECRAIIEEFCGTEDESISIERVPAYRVTKPAEFLAKYFKPEFYTIDHRLENALDRVNQKLNKRKLKLEAYTFDLTLPVQERDYVRQKRIRVARQHCYKKYKKLVFRRKELLARRMNIAGSLPIYPHNVILGKFREFGDLFPEKPTFHLVHSVRATSHTENHVYKKLIGQVARRLKPGGIMIEDGKRESYTREERIDELVALQKELGPEYRIGVIADGERTKSVLIQRAITKPDGEMVFFADSYGERLMREGHTYYPIEKFATQWPEIIFRNGIIQRFKKKYIDQASQGATPEEMTVLVHNGRMKFKGLHDIIDAVLKEKVFETEEWQTNLRNKNPEDSEYHEKLQAMWEYMLHESDGTIF